MRIQFKHEIGLCVDIYENGEPDDRVTHTVIADGNLIGEIIYQLGKFRVELADSNLSIAQALQILSRACAEFDRRGDWSDFEFDLEL